MKKAYWIIKDEIVKVITEQKNTVMIYSVKNGCHVVNKNSVFFVEGGCK